MNRLKNDDEEKKTRLPQEPLCLFYFPQSVSLESSKQTYVNVQQEYKPSRISRTTNFRETIQKKTKEARLKDKEFWVKKRVKDRIIRRRMKEPIRNLKSYLFTTVNNQNVPQSTALPSLFEVLETVKDAWPPPKRVLSPLPQLPQKQSSMICQTRMRKEIKLQHFSPLINRRFSVPEEIMRKYSISKEKTSEESEANKTALDLASSLSSSSTQREKEIKVQQIEETSTVLTKSGSLNEMVATRNKVDVGQQTDKDMKKSHDLPKKVTQKEFNEQGKKIIKVKDCQRQSQENVCTCRKIKNSPIAISLSEDVEENGSTESVLSSPIQLPKCKSYSDGMSSESDFAQCTCRGHTSSKETSTDIFHSGKSTLSQTASDQSSSTFDTTESTIGTSPNSNSYTSTSERTSAKESTTAETSPKTSRKNKKKNKYYNCNHKKTCPRYFDVKSFCDYSRTCPLHMQLEGQLQSTKSIGINTDPEKEESLPKQEEKIQVEKQETKREYSWAKLSQEELYMMQQLRHQKLLESKLAAPSDNPTEDRDTIACNYEKTENFEEQEIMIPRYSALPRTLSMLVNTSSGDNSFPNSDSDNLSLADSLEDLPTTHARQLYFDTKQESKPVRGDASIIKEDKKIKRPPKGKAFFVSIQDSSGDGKITENIEKIPQPPEKIKDKIFKRHLSICSKHKQRHESIINQNNALRKRRVRSVRSVDEPEKSFEKMKNFKKNKKEEIGKKKNQSEPTTVLKKQSIEENKNEETEKSKELKKTIKRKREVVEKRGNVLSKIPVLVSGQSTATSPDLDLRTERTSEREAEKSQEVEKTQILEITHSGKNITLQKPQTLLSTQTSINDVGLEKKKLTSIPPLLPNQMRASPSFRQNFNKQTLLSQVRRSPSLRFRQRFEMIPEEKSSSVSSTEEKKSENSQPKLKKTDASSHLPKNEGSNLREVPNLILAQITDKDLDSLPFVQNGEDQRILLFSSQPQNFSSVKGKEALIAMNREDFNKLRNGWLNFYKLNEGCDNEKSDGRKGNENKPKVETKNEKNTKTTIETGCDVTSPLDSQCDNKNQQNVDKIENPNPESPKQCLNIKKHNELPLKEKINSQKKVQNSKPSSGTQESIRLESSITVSKNVTEAPSKKTESESKKAVSLPELKSSINENNNNVKVKASLDTLRTVPRSSEDEFEDTDSDSTDYMQPPSPRIPLLPLEDFSSDGTIHSSDSELEQPDFKVMSCLIKSPRSKREGPNNSKEKKGNFQEISRLEKKKNTGWSVTVAGTVKLSKSTSDLEMRLSFPTNTGTPIVCKSDSGFVEETNYSKFSDSLQDLKAYNSKDESLINSTNTKHKWKVTVDNPKQGESQNFTKLKQTKKTNHLLPDLEPPTNRNAKKVLKEPRMKESLKRIIEGKMYSIWPKVQRVIQKEFFTDSERWTSEFEENVDDSRFLTVRGSAVSLEKKEKPLTMTERDITRRYTSRSNN